MANFAEILRELRVKRGMTQEELAERLNVSRPTIAGYESEQKGRIPRRDTLKELSIIFGVSVDYLLGITKVSENDGSPIDNRSRTEQDMTYIDRANKRPAGFGTQTYPMGRLTYVPIVAEISCGEPIFAETNILGYFPVDSQLINIEGDKDHYVYMRAVGNSMVNALITDGSMVLLRLQDTAENGDIVAVCVDNERATLKRIYYGNGTITLVPENAAMKPQQYDARRIRVVARAIWTSTHL